jgi:glycosyltransferase involved in cell wall biosynthesis
LADVLEERDRRLHIVRKTFKFDVTVVPRLARLLQRLRADVVHGYLFDAEISARLAGRLAGTPLVVGSERNTDYSLKKRQLITYRLTRWCVDLVIANSKAGAAFNRRTLGHDPCQYRVVHNGVDVERFSPGDGAAVRTELGIRPDEHVVGMFASFKRQKNHPLFFAAAKRVLQCLPNTRFLLLGEELYRGMHGSHEYKHSVERLIDELGLRDRCLFPGNRVDVERFYRACDLTVLPSLFEGTPNVALESMACGIPVVATDVADNSYVIPNGRAGYVVPLGDVDSLTRRIRRLLVEEVERKEMGRRARMWVEQEFSTVRFAEKMASVYDAALAEKCGKVINQGDRTRIATML